MIWDGGPILYERICPCGARFVGSSLDARPELCHPCFTRAILGTGEAGQ